MYVLMVLLVWCPPLDATEPDPTQDLAEVERRLSEVAGHLDWDREYDQIAAAVDRVWKKNGWVGESHEYARELVLEVAAIPPWRFLDRLSLIHTRVRQRYDLTTGQALRFQAMVLHETGRMFVRHSDVIFEQIGEVLDARQNGGSFNAEQVARWTKESEPLMADMRETVDRLHEAFRVTLRAEQADVFDRDFKAFNERWSHIEGMRAEWAEGKWKPDDWGLPNDAMQENQVRARQNAATAPAPPSQGHLPVAKPSASTAPQRGQPAAVVTISPASAIPRWLPHDPSTWFAYVLEAKKRFEFDAGQLDAAKSVHDEMVARAAGFQAALGQVLESIPAGERATHPAYQPIRHMFEHMRARVDAMATAGQRERAKAAEVP